MQAQLGQITDKKIHKDQKTQLPLLKSWEQKQDIVHTSCTQHYLRDGQPPKSSLQPESCTCLLLFFSHPVVSDSLRPNGLQHTRPPVHHQLPVCPSSRWWCHPANSVALFSFCPQSFPASGTFPMSQLFASDDQNIGTSASALVLPMSTQGWFLLRSTGSISLQSKGLSGVFSAPQFKGISSLMFRLLNFQSSHNCSWPLPALTTVQDHWEDHRLKYTDLCRQSNDFAFQHTI